MEDTPFAPFETLQPDPPSPKASEGKPAKRKGRPPKAKVAEPAQAVPKQTRKKRIAKAPKAERGPALDVATAIMAFAGLKGDECKLVGELVIKLQATPKRSRNKIVAALGRVFA